MSKKWNVTVEHYEEIKIQIRRQGYSDPGKMYLRNGDPGYPPEYEDEKTMEEVEIGDHTYDRKAAEKITLADAIDAMLDDLEMEEPEDDWDGRDDNRNED